MEVIEEAILLVVKLNIGSLLKTWALELRGKYVYKSLILKTFILICFRQLNHLQSEVNLFPQKYKLKIRLAHFPKDFQNIFLWKKNFKQSNLQTSSFFKKENYAFISYFFALLSLIVWMILQFIEYLYSSILRSDWVFLLLQTV